MKRKIEFLSQSHAFSSVRWSRREGWNDHNHLLLFMVLGFINVTFRQEWQIQLPLFVRTESYCLFWENRKYELLKIPNLVWFPFLLGQLNWIYNRLNEIPGDIWQLAQCRYDSCARCFHLVDAIVTILDRPIKTVAPQAANWSDQGRKSKWIRPRPVLCALKWAHFYRESSLNHELPHKSCRAREVTRHWALRIAAAHISTSPRFLRFPLSTGNTNLTATNDFWRLTKHLRGFPDGFQLLLAWKLLSFVQEK